MALGNLEIARAATLKPIEDIAGDMGLGSHLLEPYGRDVMKVSLDAIEELADRPRAKYVVVTAITPTPLGEGKTTTAVGLSQGISHIGRRAVAMLRQASMGPTLGIKGGAAGGGIQPGRPDGAAEPPPHRVTSTRSPQRTTC